MISKLDIKGFNKQKFEISKITDIKKSEKVKSVEKIITDDRKGNIHNAFLLKIEDTTATYYRTFTADEYKEI